MIRVVVVDDQALVRGGFRVLVDSAPNLLVVGEASDGAQAVELALAQRPDVILMDIRMPSMDGIEATRRILAADPDHVVRVLVLTTFDLDEYVFAALKAGASGFSSRHTASRVARRNPNHRRWGRLAVAQNHQPPPIHIGVSGCQWAGPKQCPASGNDRSRSTKSPEPSPAPQRDPLTETALPI